MRRSAIKQRGFTLIEVVAAASVLTLAGVAITQLVVAGQMQSHAAMHRARATSLARAMLAEVTAHPYADPDGSEANETSRSQFDDMDDYDGFSEPAGQVKDATGASYPERYAGFSRSVRVEPDTLAAEQLGSEAQGLQIVVTVTDRRGQSWRLDRFVPDPDADGGGENDGGEDGEESEGDG
jgi:MSHA pilin protein MshD